MIVFHPQYDGGTNATQSSTALGAEAYRAIDGNTSGNFYTDGSVTHTYFENQPWWQVDLGASGSIQTIQIYNRTDCCPERLRKYYVFVSDVPFTSTDLTQTINQPGVWASYQDPQAGSPTTINVNRTGRYVRVQLTEANYLSIAEVQVWGTTFLSPLQDLALIKAAMFVGNDGGIFRTGNALALTGTANGVQCDPNNPGVTWISLNNQYGVTQFYHGLPYPDGATYFGGTQDNGTIRGTDTDGFNRWSVIYGGDGGFVAVDPTDTRYLYAEEFKKSLKKFFNGAVILNPATYGITDPDTDFPTITTFVMDPSNSQRLWIGGRSMWRTTDGANNWLQASMPIEKQLPSGQTVARGISAIAVAPRNPNRVLAGTFDGYVYRTDSALSSSSSTTWSNVLMRDGGVVSWISFDPTDVNSNTVYATVSSFNSANPADHHIYKSIDGGASFPISIDGLGDPSIPDIPVHCIVVDPNNPSTLYVGTDLGVYMTLNGDMAAPTWAKENTGFANAPTETLAFNSANTFLFAFTHGRGVWRVPPNAAPPPPPGNNSLSINGPGAYVDVPTNPNLNITGAMTVEAWINTNTVTAQQSIMERYSGGGGGFALRLDGSNKVVFWTLANSSSGDFLQGVTSIGANSGWHHVAGVYEVGQLRIYIDGRLDAAKASTFSPAAGNSSVKIGARGDDSGFTFRGLIDEARLTAEALYCADFTPAKRLTVTNSANTKGLWKFDDSNPSVATDSSAYANNGVLQPGAGYSSNVPSDSPPSMSLSINGPGAYVDVPTNPNLNITGAITVEAWINTNTVTAQQSIMERYSGGGGGFALRLDGSNKVVFWTLANSSSGDFVQGVTSIGANSGWHHVAGVYEVGQLRIYIDGRLDAAKASTFSPAAGNSSVKIGARGDDSGFTFRGLIDEARLTAGALYCADFTPAKRLTVTNSANTKGLWKFDDSNPSVATDSSAYANNGALQPGAGYSSSVP